MNLFKRSSNGQQAVSSKIDQNMGGQKEEMNNTAYEASQLKSSVIDNPSLMKDGCTSEAEMQEETMITEEEFNKIIKEEENFNLEKSNEDTQNTRNNLVNSTIKVPNIKVFEQLVNQELKLGTWITHDPIYQGALKQKTYVESLYKIIYSKTSTDSIPSQAEYLKHFFNPEQNTISSILGDINRFESIRFPSLASTQLYLRRLYQLKDILNTKDNDGSKRYVKDGDPFNRIPTALATELEVEIGKSIAAKPGISAIYRDPKKRLSTTTLNSTFGNSIICLGQILEHRIDSNHQPKVAGMIEIIHAIKANNIDVLKTYEEKVGENYVAARALLKKINAECHFADILKLAALAVPSAMSLDLNLQLFAPATIKN
jgi:hypothetical protein